MTGDPLADILAAHADRLLAESALACPDAPGAWDAIAGWLAEEMER